MCDITFKNAKDEAMAIAEVFAEEWDREQWLEQHGRWASEEWDDARAAYAEAVAELSEVLDSSDPERPVDTDELMYAAALVRDASEALVDQVTADDDRIAEGTVDPDDVSELCTPDRELEHASAEGWDCVEGHAVYLLPDGRVVYRWYREGRGERRSRDLYVVAGALEEGHEQCD